MTGIVATQLSIPPPGMLQISSWLKTWLSDHYYTISYGYQPPDEQHSTIHLPFLKQINSRNYFKLELKEEQIVYLQLPR